MIGRASHASVENSDIKFWRALHMSQVRLSLLFSHIFVPFVGII